MTCQPYVATFTLEADDRYIVLATDGVWDGISLEQVGTCLAAVHDAADAAHQVNALAYEHLQLKYIDDNITSVVISVKDCKLAIID